MLTLYALIYVVSLEAIYLVKIIDQNLFSV
jgi:hypothetical protein